MQYSSFFQTSSSVPTDPEIFVVLDKYLRLWSVEAWHGCPPSITPFELTWAYWTYCKPSALACN